MEEKDLELLLCVSKDAFIRNTFWYLCDKQTNVIVVMKVEGTDELLGGHNIG
ncbi:hypothetical protein C2G38_2239947 [Gigaspora rosea]|uniref:TLDc domain-containing protein n=1 Tax=Gigaspora rosea TaxID=44941 RepID=A0A397W0G4_9GLOM|nr:hypothetical protein C2G38_2239947 [Gigaspora rosea]